MSWIIQLFQGFETSFMNDSDKPFTEQKTKTQSIIPFSNNDEIKNDEPKIPRSGAIMIGNNPAEAALIKEKVLGTLKSSPPYQLWESPTSPIYRDYEDETSNIIEVLKTVKGGVPFIKQILQKMPKGDLHLHLEGTLHPHELRDLVIKENLYFDLDKKLFRRKEIGKNGKARPAASQLTSEVWENIFNEIGLNDIKKTDKSASSRFFRAFALRGSMCDRVRKALQLFVFVLNALDENKQYAEMMFELSRKEIPPSFHENFPEDLSDANLKACLENLKDFIKQSVEESKTMLDNIELELSRLLEIEFEYRINNAESKVSEATEEQSRNSAQIELARIQEFAQKFKEFTITNPQSPVRLGFNLEVMRDKPASEFFARMAAAMATIQNDNNRVFGLTVDGPQHDPVARDNFKKQLRIINFLKKNYTEPKITYHVLEVNKKIATQKEMHDELWDLLREVAPERLGHATAIGESANLTKLLLEIKEKEIAVEICLSSVVMTVGAKGEKNPIRLLLNSGIPVMLNTDDEGLTGSSLTDEYVKAVQRYDLPYRFLKGFSRNSAEYSFAPGQSLNNKVIKNELIANGDNRPVVKKTIKYSLKEPFKNMHSSQWSLTEDAKRILDNSQKAQAQFRLERSFAEVEKWVATEFKAHLVALGVLSVILNSK